MTTELITNLQTDIQGRLESDPYFEDITVLTEERGDLEEEIKRRLGITATAKNEKYGACVLVMSPIGSVRDPDAGGGVMSFELTLKVMVHPKINNGASGTLKPALSIVNKVRYLLTGFESPGVCGPIVPEENTVVPVDDQWAPVAYEVRFRADESDTDEYLKVATPAIAISRYSAPATVTITCSTAGAEIYFTTDGSYPSEENGDLYTEPFESHEACTVRAGAYLDNYTPSNLARTEIS